MRNIDHLNHCSLASHLARGLIAERDGGANLLVSGTMLRQLISEGKPVPAEFSRPGVIDVLKEHYDGLEEREGGSETAPRRR